MGNFADDKAFEERFHPHHQEIAGLITRPSTASKTDDFKYNTDLGLSLAEMETGDGVMVRFAARVRRSEERNNSDVNRHPRTMEFTMRYSRPSGTPTEWLKVAADRECGHRRQATSCPYCAEGVDIGDFYDMMRPLNQRRRGRQ